jgi:hypothetical protein
LGKEYSCQTDRLKYVSGGTVLKELALRLDTNRKNEAGGKQPRCQPKIQKAG